MAIPQVLTALAVGWIGYQVLGKKKKKRKTSTSSTPDDGSTPTEPNGGPRPVDDPTTPSGGRRPPVDEPTEPHDGRLPTLDEPTPPGPRPPRPPFPRPRPIPPPVHEDPINLDPVDLPPIDDGGDDWPDYPPPAPVDLGSWTDANNYPTPGMFHQVGGDNSASTLQAIARMALTTAFYLTFGDLAVAKELARDGDNWRAYREAIECSPWNHALYGSASRPGTSGYYETPHGDQISMFPVHANVETLLATGQPPERRVRTDDPRLPAGGRHAYLWLPPLDEDVLANGRVKVKHEHWWTGDWVVMPPPEVLALGVVGVPPGAWGCGDYETTYDFDDQE